MSQAVNKRPVSRRLPYLHTLLAFDAAARHGSFLHAADELCVTQSAVSQRIRALESFLRVQLFRRLGRGVALTEVGGWFAPRVAEILSELERLCGDVGNAVSSTRLEISSVSSFASRWLVPRLHAFTRENPQLSLRIRCNSGFARAVPQEVDAAILWGVPSDWPDMEVFKFVDVTLFPVCSPDLCSPTGLEPRDLQHHRLLAHSRRNYWPAWLARAGLDDMPVTWGAEYDDASLALEAAIHGQGWCISNEVLAGDALSAGQLTRPFATELPSDNSYFLVCRASTAREPKLQHLLDWLRRTITLDNDRRKATPSISGA